MAAQKSNNCWRGRCAICNEPVQSGGNIKPPGPKEKVVCIWCLITRLKCSHLEACSRESVA